MKIAVGKLEVSVYIEAEDCEDKWDLICVPVMKCPYYLTLDTGNRTIHDNYVCIAKRRHPNWGDTYEDLIKLFCNIEKNGFNPELAPMSVWKDTTMVNDGHHRAAVLCKLYGPGFDINVVEDGEVEDNGYPPKHYRCSNPCKE